MAGDRMDEIRTGTAPLPDAASSDLLMARALCSSTLGIPPLLGITIALLGYGGRMGALVIVAVVASLVIAIAGVVAFAIAGRWITTPRACMIANIVTYSIVEFGVLIGFVAAVISENWVVYVAVWPAAYAAWAWMWPRTGVWRNWLANA